MTTALEVADSGIVSLGPEGACREWPAYARIEAAEVVVGDAARAEARLKPASTHDRFLAELSSLPLPQPAPAARTQADLAYALLRQIAAGLAAGSHPFVAALPSHWRGAHAGTFAATARAAGLQPLGFVDAAVAATWTLPGAAALYLDVDLHQSRLVRVDGDERRRRAQVEVSARVGRKALDAAWAHSIAETFVRRTRFDPLHDGVSEQRLYDALPGWLERMAAGATIDVELAHGDGVAAASIAREQLLLAGEAYYTQLAELVTRLHRDGEALTLALHARAAALPGLAERLARRRGIEVVSLAPDAAASGALAACEAIAAAGPEAVCLALPRAGVAPGATAAAAPARSIAEHPTHVLAGGRAHPITRVPLVLGRAPDDARSLPVSGPAAGLSRRHCSLVRDGVEVRVVDHSRYGTFVNGARVAGSAPLAAGDRLRLGTPGVEFELVAVTHDGTP